MASLEMGPQRPPSVVLSRQDTTVSSTRGGKGDHHLMTVTPGEVSDFFASQFTSFKDFTMNTAKVGLNVGEKSALWAYEGIKALSQKWFTHIFLLVMVFLYGVLGALLFYSIESPHETQTKSDVLAVRTEVLDVMWERSQNDTLNRTQWEEESVLLMKKFENEVKSAVAEGVRDDVDEHTWTYWNSMFFCGTVYTTIGYGHMAPATTLGRAVTILYAVIGIPLFLILLADYGKLFTRGIKFVMAFLRRLYYTGSCRRVRKTAPVKHMSRGIRRMYNIATFSKEEEPVTTPSSEPEPPQYEIDDEFNLPISLAVAIQVGYMLLGALVYMRWESWTFFESFYFVFISMSTIGFGDFVPQHPMYMMASIIYLVFGLALTSMCINVVQEKISDTFKKASDKLSEKIGIEFYNEDESEGDEKEKVTPQEVAEVHQPTKKST